MPINMTRKENIMLTVDRDIVVRAGRYEWLFREGSEIVKKDGATYILPPKTKKNEPIESEVEDEQDH